MTLDDDVGRLARTRPFNLLPREAVQLIAAGRVAPDGAHPRRVNVEPIESVSHVRRED